MGQMMQAQFPGFLASTTTRCRTAKVARGMSAHASGAAAEKLVEDDYLARGCDVLARRWRGLSGEIDLILRDGGGVVFVEVKKSTSFDMATERLSRRQMDRICLAALEFCDTLPTGSLTEMRFDAALVDTTGAIQIIENAFGEH